ncbi:unnamed protein product [Prorocentrum cordatum]|uniref:Peptidase A1 domain-containing protein n=1 Tax=Prorocentrum cordatum TaxID=2364126 RepID=A0ABN9TV41_9DINO|nr:unnamed protein product [Polarella glacialis]
MVRGSTALLAAAARATLATGIHLTSFDGGQGSLENRFSVVADTGSNSLIVPSCVCQDKGQCSKKDRCFRGTNKSSTFHLEVDEEEKPVSMVLSFGSGQIQAIVAQEQVSVGKVSRHLKDDGLLLMTDRALQISGPFEGILGLGLPQPATNWTQIEEQEQAAADSTLGGGSMQDIIQQILGHANGAGGAETAIPDQVMRKILDTAVTNANGTTLNATTLKTHKPHHRDSPKGFLEQVNIPRFSMCFNDGADGVLRIGGAPLGNGSHGGMGTAHWGVDFRGISVGDAAATPVDFCRDSDMAEGQKSPCGAIPDSGTTLMMGPAPQIEKLLDSICEQWPRCKSNYTKLLEAEDAATKIFDTTYGVNPFSMHGILNKSDILQLLLQDCDRWMTNETGTDGMPDLHFHVRGTHGTKQAIKIPAHAYIMAYAGDNVTTAYSLLAGVGNIPADPDATRGAKKVCAPAFGAMDYNTKANGPVWIMGTPLFYEYVVAYDMDASPPAIAFHSQQNVPCGSCQQSRAEVNLALKDPRNHQESSLRMPRRVEGAPRQPNVDYSQPL